MTCENCNRETSRGIFVHCCARATYTPIACSDPCATAMGGVDPQRVLDCGIHCSCGDCDDCILAAMDKRTLKFYTA